MVPSWSNETRIRATPNLVFGGVGFSWRFDGNYSDLMLRIPKEDTRSKEDKKQDKSKDKNKSKKRKRLDVVGEDEKKN